MPLNAALAEAHRENAKSKLCYEEPAKKLSINYLTLS